MGLDILSFSNAMDNMMKNNPSQAGLRDISPATGSISIDPGLKIQVVKASGAPYPIPKVELVHGKTVKASMQGKEIKNLGKKLNDLSFSDHRNVLTNADWQAMYRYPSVGGTTSIPYVTSFAGATTNTEEAYPCHNCGLVMPARVVQVDHHHPRSAGQGMAVLKALRAAGLTKAAASGPKAGHVKAGKNYAFIPPKGHLPGAFSHSTAPSASRYALNDKGRIFLTVVAVANQVEALKSVCVNSVINLVPLCAYCNGSAGKGSGVKPVRP